MPSRDLYKILNVDRRASTQQIKRAYYKLALQLHPDARQEKDQEQDALFAEVAEAYAVLGDARLRQRYDTLGPWTRHLGAAGPAWHKMAQDPRRMRQAVEQSLNEFERQTALLDQQRGKQRSTDHAGTLRFAVNAMTTWARARRDRSLMRDLDTHEETGACEACQGTGAAPTSRMLDCSMCRSTGTIGWHKGFVRLTKPCSACQGKGQRPDILCPLCLGQPIANP